MDHRGFDLIEQHYVGTRCFQLGKHRIARDIYVVWEKGTPWVATAKHFDDERNALIELRCRRREAEQELEKNQNNKLA